MGADKELWKAGKSLEEANGKETVEDEALDLSSPSPEIEANDEIDLNKIEDDSLPLLLEEEDGVNMRIIGIVGVVVILLLTGSLIFLLYAPKIVINVPHEKYEEEIIYDIEGTLNLNSIYDVPLPAGTLENDVVINQLDIEFNGQLRAGIKGPSEQIMDGYGNMRNVLQKYLVQTLDDVDGSITETGKDEASFENAEMVSSQFEFIDIASLDVVKTKIESNASLSNTAVDRWYKQSATNWVPKDSSKGLLPHGDTYIGRTLEEGTNGIVNEGGIAFEWKVENGGKIKGERTALLIIETSFVGENWAGFVPHYSYSFHFYMSEVSSLPLKFVMKLDAGTFYGDSSENALFAINMKYEAEATEINEGYIIDVPTNAYDSGIVHKTGEFEPWMEGAPALGNGSLEHKCGIDSEFTLQTEISQAKDEIPDFNEYMNRHDPSDNEPAFVIEANYTAIDGEKWNFTVAYQDEQVSTVKAWNIEYHRTENLTYSKELKNDEDVKEEIKNPIMSMDDIPDPLTICSAEEVMTDFDEIASWSVNDMADEIDYTKVRLLLGQNLASKQSLASPISIINFGSLNPINIVSELTQGNFNFNALSSNVDVDAAGSYAYFLEKKGHDNTGNSHQELAAVDAKDGLVLFNIQTMSSTD